MVGEEGMAAVVSAAFAEGERSGRRVRELAARLSAVVRATAMAQRVEALAALAHWTMQPDQRLPLPTAVSAAKPEPAHRRLVVLLALLEHPEIAPALGGPLAELLASSDGVSLFAETGLPNDRGLLQETADRLFRRILPAP